MRRTRRPQTEAPGQDSFLDVVANLVGILIILVMVVGARAKDAWVESGDKSVSSSVTALENKVAASMKETEALRNNINEILADSTGQEVERVTRDADRDFIMSAHQAKDYGLVDQVMEQRD